VLGLFCRKASAKIANIGLTITFLIMLTKLFFKRFPGGWLGQINELHFVAIVFAAAVLTGVGFSFLFPARKENEHEKTVWLFSVNCFGYGKNTAAFHRNYDYRPWKDITLYSVLLLLIVIAFYVFFADPTI